LTRTAEWIDMARPQWEADYDGKGAAAMISARNFKAVNDVLGHDAGDRYLKRLGVIMRVEVNRLRKLGYSVEEPVRAGGKEFLLVGKDAAEAARLVEKKFAAKLAAGEVLPSDQLERLRAEAPGRGLIPAARVDRLGTLRVIDEPFTSGFKDTFERVILKLESIKAGEESGS
jgi:GGDEF domain-containing protein